MTYVDDLFRELADRGERRDPQKVIDEVLQAVLHDGQPEGSSGTPDDVAPVELRRLEVSSATSPRSRWWAAAAALVVVAGVGVSQLDRSSDVAVTGRSDDEVVGPEGATVRAFGELPDVSAVSPLWPADPNSSSAPRDPDVAVERFAREVLGTEPESIIVTGTNDDGSHRWVTLGTDGGATVDLIVRRHESTTWSVDFERSTLGGGSESPYSVWTIDFDPQPVGGTGEIIVVRVEAVEVVELTETDLRQGSAAIDGPYEAGILITRNAAGEVTSIGLAGGVWASPRWTPEARQELSGSDEGDEPTLVNEDG